MTVKTGFNAFYRPKQAIVIPAVDTPNDIVVAAGIPMIYEPTGNYRMLATVSKYTPEGEQLWYREYVGIDQDSSHMFVTDIEPTPDGGYILCGEHRYFVPRFEEDFHMTTFLLKIDADGNPIDFLVPTIDQELPTTPRLTVYPNPTSGQITIQNTAASSYRLVNITGTYSQSFDRSDDIDLSGMPAGVYLIHGYDADGHLIEIGKVVKGE